jgi:hypothetical protein
VVGLARQLTLKLAMLLAPFLAIIEVLSFVHQTHRLLVLQIPILLRFRCLNVY